MPSAGGKPIAPCFESHELNCYGIKAIELIFLDIQNRSPKNKNQVNFTRFNLLQSVVLTSLSICNVALICKVSQRLQQPKVKPLK